MKKIIKNIIIIAILSVIASSCFKDDSTTYDTIIHKVKVYIPEKFHFTSPYGRKYISFSVNSGETLVIQPDSVMKLELDGEEIKISDPDNSDYKFEWWYGDYYSQGKIKKISDGINFNQVIDQKPGAYGDIILSVTHKASGMESIFSYNLEIKSILGNGLIVADTKDESTSRINELQHITFYGESQAIAMQEGSYEKLVGNKFEGLITSIFYDRDYTGDPTESRLYLFKENGAEILDGNFISINSGNNIFSIDPGFNKVNHVVRGGYNGYFVNDKRLQTSDGDKLNFPIALPSPTLLDYNISCLSLGFRDNSQEESYKKASDSHYAFDENSNGFLRIDLYGAQMFKFNEGANSTLFNFDNVGNFDALFLGYSNGNNSVISVLKSESSNDYYLYGFQGARNNASWETLTEDSQYIKSLEKCTDLVNAKYFASSFKGNLLYFATENKIFASNIYVDQKPTQNEIYQVASGEKITSMRMWTSDNGKIKIDSDEYELARHRMIMITTYNDTSKEGKIICLPIENLNNSDSCLADESRFLEFGGFGRILSISDM